MGGTRSARPAILIGRTCWGGGAQGRNRTADTVIFSHVLYQLSYLGLTARRGKSGAYRGAYCSLSSPAGGPGTR